MAIADIVMSLDNVLAIAAVAKDSIPLLVMGLVVSIPLIVVGASLITALLERFPILIWAGAGLLGWVAGEMLDSDPWLVQQFGCRTSSTSSNILQQRLGAAFVLITGYMIKKRQRGPASWRTIRCIEAGVSSHHLSNASLSARSSRFATIVSEFLHCRSSFVSLTADHLDRPAALG